MTKYCECGCGQIVEKGNRFVYHHAWRGRRHSIESRKKMSLSRLKRPVQKPEVRKKISDGLKKSWQNPEIRKKRLESINYEAMRMAAQKMWKNPQYREKVMKAQRESEAYRKCGKKISRALRRWREKNPRRAHEIAVMRGKTTTKKYGGWFGFHKIFAEKNPSEYHKMGSARVKKMWQRPEYVRKQMIARGVKPNKPEKKMMKIIANNNLPYRYCGGGDVILGGRCPDFINCDGGKKLVELFGIYWHGNFPDEAQRRILESKRAEHFAGYGFSTLIIWEDELDDLEGVVEKIKDFTGAVT